jgi:hypothetical protein
MSSTKSTVSSIPRCQHGIYLPEGHSYSAGCQQCNPEANSHALVPTKNRFFMAPRERALNTHDFTQLAPSFRIALGFGMIGASQQ